MQMSCHLLSMSKWVKLLLSSTSVYCDIQVANNNIIFLLIIGILELGQCLLLLLHISCAHLEIIGFPVGSAY